MLSQKYIMATYRFKGNMEVIVRVYIDVRKYQNEGLKVEPPRRGYPRPDPSIRYKMMGEFRRIMEALSGDQSIWNAPLSKLMKLNSTHTCNSDFEMK
jgi:hypothetical protein